MKKLNRYRIHLLIGLFFVPFLFISALTGFFRANHKWFWKEDYKKIKNFTFNFTVTPPSISLDSAFTLLGTSYGPEVEVMEIRLRREIGKLLYDIRFRNHPPVLMDASTGAMLSPLTKDLAVVFSNQYVKPELKVANVYRDDRYVTRKEKKLRPVFVVSYADALNTQIYIDTNNGEIVEESDNNLKFGFWMVKLHDYDFSNTKRFTLSFVGLGLIVLSGTGIYLWITKKKKRKKKHKQTY